MIIAAFLLIFGGILRLAGVGKRTDRRVSLVASASGTEGFVVDLTDQAEANLQAFIAMVMVEVDAEITALREVGCSDAEIVAFLRSVPS